MTGVTLSMHCASVDTGSPPPQRSVRLVDEAEVDFEGAAENRRGATAERQRFVGAGEFQDGEAADELVTPRTGRRSLTGRCW